MPECPSPPAPTSSAPRGRKSRRLAVTMPRCSFRTPTRVSGSDGDCHSSRSAIATASCPRARSSAATSGENISSRRSFKASALVARRARQYVPPRSRSVEVDPLVDLIALRAVVGDGRLDQAERDLQVLGRGSLVAVVVADDRDDFPNIESGALEARRRPAGPSTKRISGCSSVRSLSST